MKSHSLWKTKASVSWAACRSSSNGLRELRTLQTSCESRGWEMSSCKPIKLHWTNTLWAFSRADGRRPCLQHTHERTPDIRDGKRQWAKTRSSFLFFFSLFFIFLDFQFLFYVQDANQNPEMRITPARGDGCCRTVHGPRPRHRKRIFISHFHDDWLY